jgi:ribosome-associated protein
MLPVSRSIVLPESELVVRFLRADGPGGQHVNRTESAVELRFDVLHSPSLPDDVRARLLARQDRRLTDDGVLVIQARRFRDQGRNREDARERLVEIVRGALTAPKKRVATKPTRASQQRRLEGKQLRAKLKQTRSRSRSYE